MFGTFDIFEHEAVLKGHFGDPESSAAIFTRVWIASKNYIATLISKEFDPWRFWLYSKIGLFSLLLGCCLRLRWHRVVRFKYHIYSGLACFEDQWSNRDSFYTSDEGSIVWIRSCILERYPTKVGKAHCKWGKAIRSNAYSYFYSIYSLSSLKRRQRRKRILPRGRSSIASWTNLSMRLSSTLIPTNWYSLGPRPWSSLWSVPLIDRYSWTSSMMLCDTSVKRSI